MLELREVQLGVQAPVSVRAARGEIVAVVGRNGSGKSSLLRAIAGESRINAGDVIVDGAALGHMAAHARVASGVVFVSEDRDIFGGLTVEDHLRLFSPEDAQRRAALEVFPRLGELTGQRASTLSGGEQQMLAMARAVAHEPKVLLGDEPGAGLSPKLVDDLYKAILRIAERGAAVVIAEQHVGRAMDVADTVVVLGNAGAAFVGPVGDISEEVLTGAFLGRR
jgi:branched-chain amino acid transport system ATP-binding protein